jgi:hypothetical protein
LRDATKRVVKATLAVRHSRIWGEGTTACASDSKHFGAFDQGRQGPQMLSGEAGTLARKLAEALRVDAFGAGRIETDCSENGALLYQTRKGAVTGSAWRLTRPGQLAHCRAFLGCQQRIQRFGLLWRQVSGQLMRHLALGKYRRRLNAR